MKRVVKYFYSIWEKNILLVFLDVLIVLSSYLLALLMRFDFLFSKIPEDFYQAYSLSMPFWVVATIVVFYGMKLYHRIWRLASISDFAGIIAAHIVLVLVYGAGVCWWEIPYFFSLKFPFDRIAVIRLFQYNHHTAF